MTHKNIIHILWLMLLMVIFPLTSKADEVVTFTATSASEEGFKDEKYTNIFDGNTTNKWCGNISSGQAVNVQFQASSPISVSSYYLYTGNDINYGNRNPKTWKLYARLNTSDAWDEISDVTNSNLPHSNSTKSQNYDVKTESQCKLYKYFMFEFTAVELNNVFEIGEFCLNYKTFDVNTLSIEGEENTPNDYGVRSGRISEISPVTINGVTYTLYNDYYYCPIENGVKQESLKRGASGIGCVITVCAAEGELNIPSSVTFEINEVLIPVPVVAIGEGALLHETNRVTSLSIPSCVVVIEKCALEDREYGSATTASTLLSIRFENGDNPLFMHCGSDDSGALSMDIALQQIYVGRNMEYNANCNGILEGSKSENLTVTFDDNVTSIPANMFKSVTGLKSVTLPASLTTIPASMCEGCTGLTAVEIPAMVESIGAGAFIDCSNIATYTLLPTTPPTVTATSLSGSDDYQIIVPDNTLGYYLKETTGWLAYKNHFDIPEYIHHLASEPTETTPGYIECLEVLSTHKYYDINDPTIELNPAKVVKYKSLAVIPTMDLDEVYTLKTDVVYDEETFDWAAELKFHATNYNESLPWTSAHTAKFKVNVPLAGDARIRWYRNFYNYYSYCDFWSNVNGSKNYCVDDFAGGVSAFTLPNLKENDEVDFSINAAHLYYKTYDATVAVCLEYTIPYSNITANQDPDNTADYYTTFCDSRFSYTLNGAATAYTASISGNNIVLKPIDNNIIPKGEAVIIRSTSPEVALTPSDSNLEKNATNILRGYDSDVAAPENCYILSYGQNKLGFYKYAEGNRLTAHKAYLTYSAPATGAKGLRMIFTEGEATGVTRLLTSPKGEDIIYNLSGMRLNKLQKGVNIVNGKKLFIK